MEFQEIKKTYLELTTRINELLHPLASAYEHRILSPQKIEIEIKKTVSNKNLRDNIFVTFLNMIGVTNIKYINMKSISYNDIFNTNIHQIINSICNESQDFKNKLEPYKYHIMAFYVILSELSEKACTHSFFRTSQLYFFEGVYSDIKFLKTIFLMKYVKAKFPREDFSNIPKCINTRFRQQIDIILGIRNLLYGGTVLDASSTDQPNMAIFIIRSYIENWMRANFNAYISGTSFIQISNVFCVLRKYSNAIKGDKLASELKNIDRHIETLSIINEWSNLYVHTERRAFFWVPHIIFKYLYSLLAECRTAYAKVSKTVNLYPPFIPRESDIYLLICKDIEAFGKDNTSGGETDKSSTTS